MRLSLPARATASEFDLEGLPLAAAEHLRELAEVHDLSSSPATCPESYHSTILCLEKISKDSVVVPPLSLGPRVVFLLSAAV